MEERNFNNIKIHNQKKDYFNHPFSIDNLLQICNPIKSLEIFSSGNSSNQNNFSNEHKEHTISGEKKKRHRSTFTATQIRILEYEFMKSRYISTEHRSRLANFLGISEQQIKIWFQNRRYKTRLLFLNKNENNSNCMASLNMQNQNYFTAQNHAAN
ncbi:Homeobox protein Nkx-3.1 [Strongyloides ratti]|uniref:Homeobox protein Nkx-3.1 n=1 Tax=Strongyloides ratti TaxID=34506 RepID=A0A090LI20_STRRB|nr:Homeobox protein Nkx-3.1 [Strongyloides ratti]CEF69387.1 Homeobox protein Nkx-3.1 [Strongyloides ratti]